MGRLDSVTGNAIQGNLSVLRAISILLFGGYVIYSGVALLKGGYEADEGFYLLTAKLVSEGQRPYADFGLTQPPAYAWLGSLVLPYLGWTVYGTRLLGLLLSFSLVVAGSVFLFRKKGWDSVCLFLSLSLSSPGWMERAVIGKPFALGGLVALISCMVLLSGSSSISRWWLYVAVSAIGCLVRMPLAPLFVFGSIGLLWGLPNWRVRMFCVSGALLAALVVALFLGWNCWESLGFWLIEPHRMRSPEPSSRYGYLFLITKDGLSHGTMAWMLLPLAVWFQKRDPLYMWMTVGLVFSLVLNLGTVRGYGVYAVYFTPVPFMLVSWSLGPMVGRLEQITKPAFIYLSFGIILLGGWAFRNHPYPWEFAGYMDSYDSAVRFLRSNVPEGSNVVATTVEVPVSANCEVPNKLAMGMFGFTDTMSQDKADRVHIATTNDVIGYLEDPSTRAWVGSASQDMNYFWSTPDQLTVGNENRMAIHDCLSKNYNVAFVNRHYAILLRKDQNKNRSEPHLPLTGMSGR